MILHTEQRGHRQVHRLLNHSALLFGKLPLLFRNPFVRRRSNWADVGERLHPVQAASPA